MAENGKVRRLVLLGLSCALVVGSAGWFYTSSRSYQAQMREKQNELATLQGDLDAAKAEAEFNTVSQEEMEQMAHSAKATGEAVATLENQYMSLMQQKVTNAEEESAQREQLLAMSDQFDGYFGENTDMRTAWYNWNAEAAKGVSWEFCTNYTFTADTMNVLWKCMNESGQMLAYATAVYQAETDTFTDAVVHVTAIGAQYAPYTEGEEDLSVDQDLSTIWDTMDQISLPDDFNEKYQEQANDEERLQGVEENKGAAADLREQMMNGGDEE